MKRIVVGLMAVCLLGSLTVLAEEKATAEKAVKKEVVLQDITATGKLAKLAVGFTVTEADGTVVNIHPVSGNDTLVTSAMDAARWWRFRPYRVRGEPATVETTLSVEFRP